jgi:hypothetical protein
MITLSARAFDEATRLPDTEQDAPAKRLLAESEDVLDKFANKAIQAKRVRTKP